MHPSPACAGEGALSAYADGRRSFRRDFNRRLKAATARSQKSMLLPS